MRNASACPDISQFKKLATGQLSSPDKESLLDHLEGCHACVQRAEALSAKDTLVDLIRQARTLGNGPSGETVARLIERLRGLRPSAEAAGKAPAQIRLACSGCGKSLKIKVDLAGKKIKCPHCQAVIPVPIAVQLRGEASRQSPASEFGDALTLAPTSPAGGRSSTATASDAGAGQSQAASTDQHLCDFLAPAQAADELGRLGPYRILRVLGAGGMGVVFQAEDPHLRRIVALKAMLPGMAASDLAKQRFLREARAAAALNHDHIVTIHQVGEDRGAPYLAMEFLEGESLDDRLKRAGKLPLADLLRIGREMAEGLAAAHERGLIHRDIKPANVWLEGKKGRVKILDFGLARASTDESHLTQSGAIVGTPAYMAPEQAQGKNVDPRCDLFSLGCVLYRMATGEAPFKGTDMISTLMAVSTEDPRPPHELEPALPPPLSELILALLAKEPADRPSSAQLVADTLDRIAREQAARSTSLTIHPEGSPDKTAGMGRSTKKRPPLAWLVGMAGGLAAAVIAGIVLFWQTPYGTVRIESDDPSVEIVFDKTGPTIKGAGKEPISLRAGEHGILVKRGDFTFGTDKLLIKKGETITLKVELLLGKIQLVQDGKVIASGEIPLVPKSTNSLGMKLVLIPAGKFTMGSAPQEIERCLGLARADLAPPTARWPGFLKAEAPEHEVEITQPFYMGVHEVTVGQFRQFVTENKYQVGDDRWLKPGFEQTDDHPVVFVTWNNAVDFCTWLSEKEGKQYRLPTEAEWEYSCRAGKAGARYGFGSQDADLGLYAWYKTNSGGKTHPVGKLKENEWGLFDMHGNAGEWCQDYYDANYYKTSRKQNPPGPSAGGERVFRGGTWDEGLVLCRSAWRNPYAPGFHLNSVGFRVVLVVSSPGGIPVGKEPIAAPPPVEKKTEAPPSTFKNNLGMEFVLVPKGRSWLNGGGGTQHNAYGWNWEPGDKEVEITNDFYLGRYEVTQEEWYKVMGTKPSFFSRVAGGKDAVKDIPEADLKRFPVEQVSWEDAQLFLRKLNDKDKEAGWLYRLPKEVEWEYACRGGPLSNRSEGAYDFYLDKRTNQLQAAQANFAPWGALDKGLKRTCKVGSYKPNALGLYDMHGNVWEWCDDTAKAADGALRRVLRGGSLDVDSIVCRAATRNAYPPSARFYSLGLRVARVPVGNTGAIPQKVTEAQLRQRIETAWPGLGNRLSKDKAGNYTLYLRGCAQVTDLTPLKGMPLTTLNVTYNGELYDLTPLQGMKLKSLWIGRCGRIRDLRPLQGMELDFLDLAQCNGLDLRHLQGMKIKLLSLWNRGSNHQLRSLQGVQLNGLIASFSPIDDLTPLQGMAITELIIDHCDRLSDLTPLKDMPLNKLNIKGCDKIKDLSPLKDLPLKEIVCDFKPERDAKILRAIKTLETINGTPVAQFWKKTGIITPPVPAGKTLTVDLGGGLTMEFARIPAGSFTMGSPQGDAARHDDEDEHPVRISKDFYLGKYPVTQAQYAAITGANPSYFCASSAGKDKVAGMDTSQFPVEQMSWQDAVTFCDKLSARDPKKRRFRLLLAFSLCVATTTRTGT